MSPMYHGSVRPKSRTQAHPATFKRTPRGTAMITFAR
jgi:hypothetical protein